MASFVDVRNILDYIGETKKQYSGIEAKEHIFDVWAHIENIVRENMVEIKGSIPSSFSTYIIDLNGLRHSFLKEYTSRMNSKEFHDAVTRAAIRKICDKIECGDFDTQISFKIKF